jgi:hypothetical protein
MSGLGASAFARGLRVTQSTPFSAVKAAPAASLSFRRSVNMLLLLLPPPSPPELLDGVPSTRTSGTSNFRTGLDGVEASWTPLEPTACTLNPA